MKKLILSAAVLMLAVAGFTATSPDINEKVLDAFKKTFTNTQELKWYENANSFEARFNNEGTRTIVWYNKAGELLKTHRYYEGYKLPPFVLNNIRKKLSDQTILGVTEITNETGINYYITLEGEKSWMKIKADAQGEFEVYEKFKKA